jgi:Fur family ferric uptake transcriptional regulator
LQLHPDYGDWEEFTSLSNVGCRRVSSSRSSTGLTAEEVRERIRAAGLRSTAPRIAVYRKLFDSTAPVSHPELVDQLAPEGFDRATIYRNLTDLVEVGLVTRRDLGDHVWRFELRRDEGHILSEHPHFTCVSCGQVSCLPGVRVELKLTPEAPPSSALVEFDEVQLKGRCATCTSAQA